MQKLKNNIRNWRHYYYYYYYQRKWLRWRSHVVAMCQMVPPKSNNSSAVFNLDQTGFVLPRTQLHLVLPLLRMHWDAHNMMLLISKFAVASLSKQVWINSHTILWLTILFYLLIYLLCKSHQGTQKIVKKNNNKRKKTYKKTPHTVHIYNLNKMLSYRRETALQGALQFSPKVEDWNWETIFYGHYRSIFNHCHIIGLKICQIPWENAK